MIAKEMIAEKVFAEGVAKDIRNFLPAKYENAEFQVMQMNKNNGVGKFMSATHMGMAS